MARQHHQLTVGPVEVKPSHRPSERPESAVKEVHRDAKTEAGAVFRDAIGPDKQEAYGSAALISGLCSGEKVPDYLAAIFANREAKLRMAKSILRRSGSQVEERTVFTINERVG